MNDEFDAFLEKTLSEVSDMYANDEFRDGYNEAVETFKNAVYDYFENNYPDADCKVLECDADYYSLSDIMEYIGEEVKGKTIIDYRTTGWNDSVFLILKLKKEQ